MFFFFSSMRARQARRFSLRAQALTKVNLANNEHLQKNKYLHLKGQFHGSAHVHKSKYFFRSLSMLSLSKPHSHVVQ